jgi:bla regulator protein BlaR1
MSLSVIGWVVAHSLWQATFIAGLTALPLGLLRNARAQVRYWIGCASLATMVVVSLATAFTGTTSIGRIVRYPLLTTADRMLGDGFPTFVTLVSIVVPAIGVAWLAGFTVSMIRVALE